MIFKFGLQTLAVKREIIWSIFKNLTKLAGVIQYEKSNSPGWINIDEWRDHLQIALLVIKEFKWIHQLLFPLISSENQRLIN